MPSKSIPINLRYVDDIAHRESRNTNSNRTMDEFLATHKKYQSTQPIIFRSTQKLPTDNDFPSLGSLKPTSSKTTISKITTSNTNDSDINDEIDEAILDDLELHLFEGAQRYNKFLQASHSFADELQFIESSMFYNFHFLNDAGWYRECNSCYLNYLTDSQYLEKCTCRLT